MGTGGPFLGGKERPGRDADHSPPSSAEVENEYELYILSSKRLQSVLWDSFIFFFVLLFVYTARNSKSVTRFIPSFREDVLGYVLVGLSSFESESEREIKGDNTECIAVSHKTKKISHCRFLLKKFNRFFVYFI
jgi:hypothetical protein